MVLGSRLDYYETDCNVLMRGKLVFKILSSMRVAYACSLSFWSFDPPSLFCLVSLSFPTFLFGLLLHPSSLVCAPVPACDCRGSHGLSLPSCLRDLFACLLCLICLLCHSVCCVCSWHSRHSRPYLDMCICSCAYHSFDLQPLQYTVFYTTGSPTIYLPAY